ncbi:MAG: PAS domain-containing sensor histidine kinase [Chloroflexota bacterium]
MVTHNTLDAWRSQFNLLFNTISDGVIILDHTGVLLRINPAAAGMLRCTPEEIYAKPPDSVFGDLPDLLDLLLGNDPLTRHVVLPANRIALGIAETQPEGGRLVVLQDITEREELDSRREQLIATIGHDLRNPSAAIFGFAELVTLYGPLNAEQDRFVARIAQTATKLQHVAYSLVDLAWVESGMPLQNLPVDLGQVIEQAIVGLEGEAHVKQITITLEVQPSIVVMGDAMRLQQVVYNLLNNAILYSDSGQPILIKAIAQQGKAQVSVADHGIGMTTDDLDQIFTRMYRAESEAVRNVPGGGVGLTMARVILKRHGGSIKANSTVGEGSTFSFTLPLAT